MTKPTENRSEKNKAEKKLLYKVRDIASKLDSVSPSDIVHLIEHVGTTVGLAFFSLNILADLIKKWLEVYKKKVTIDVQGLKFEYEGGMSQAEVRRITKEIIGLLRSRNDTKLILHASDDEQQGNKEE